MNAGYQTRWTTIVVPTVLLVAALVALVGCAGTPEAAPCPESAPCPTAAPVAEPKNNGTWYFLAANVGDPFYNDIIKGFTEIADANGYTVKIAGPSDLNVAEQVKALDTIAADPATRGVFIYSLDHKALRPSEEEAIAKGIPIVLGDSDSPTRTRDAFVGYDNNILGAQAAEQAVKIIGTKGKVGSIGVAGPALLRRQAFEKYLNENYPDITVYETAMQDGSATGAEAQLNAYLVAHPDLDLLWWADGMAGQMATIWKEKQAAGSKTHFLAMDMPATTLQAVKDGIFDATIGQDVYTGARQAALLLNELDNGKRVPDTSSLSAIIVTPENVDKYLE